MHNSIVLPAILLLLLAPAAWGQRERGSDRFARALEEWDEDGDGVVTKEEAPGNAWEFIQRRAESAGLDAKDRVSIAELSGKDQKTEKEGSDRSRDKKVSSKNNSSEKANPMAFGSSADLKLPPGFDSVEANDTKEKSTSARSSSSRNSTSSKKDDSKDDYSKARSYADGLIKQYDKNKSGALERDEWKDIRGEPAKADPNKDGVITRDELTNRMLYNIRKKKSGSKPEKGREPKSRDEDREAVKRETYRFTPPQERLPEGLPSWFKSKDKNGDGQVAMHEYNRRWTDRSTREFTRYDKNGDGVVTPDEVVKKKR